MGTKNTEQEIEQEIDTEIEPSIEDFEKQESGEDLETEADVEGETETEADPGEGEVPEVPAYTPNFKFKIKDQELEFDEVFRPFVNNPEVEAKFREFHEKAYGIDEVKKHRDEIRQNFEAYRQNYDPVLRVVQTAQQHYQRDNVDGVLEALGLDRNKMLEWARREQAIESLSPAARAEYDRQRQREREYFQSQQESEYTREQLTQLRREQKISEINAALSSPEAMGLQASFDQRLGPGAFKAELIRRGQLHQAQTGQEKTAFEIVNEMIQMFGHQAPAQSQVPNKATAPKQAGAPIKKQVPVIPATKSSGTSSVRKAIKSIDDMFKERDEM